MRSRLLPLMAFSLCIGLVGEILLLVYGGQRNFEIGVAVTLFLVAFSLFIMLVCPQIPGLLSKSQEEDNSLRSTSTLPDLKKIDPALPLIFHEIMNYASTMKGNTILLRRELGVEASKASLERLERATEQIQRIARGVMDATLMSKPEDFLPVSLEAIIKECAENYFSNLGLTFSITSDRVALPLNGDYRKLEQVFLNLFKNSMEAGATKISVALLAQQEKIGVLIEDNGKGCSSEDIERMFEAYYSLRSSQGGSGLGMFLVKAIVEGHGGTISGFSKTGKAHGIQGMMFVMQFPFDALDRLKNRN